MVPSDWVPFLKVKTLDMTVLKDKNTVCTYGFQLGIPSLTSATYTDVGKDKCLIATNYKFKFTGLQILIYPLIKFLIPKWNKRTWYEDLPLKQRRQKVKRMNFKDFNANKIRICNFHLKNLKNIKLCLPRESRILLVNTLMLSTLDYCNSLLAGLPGCDIYP